MRVIRILKRESWLVVAREVLWRARREWNKRRMLVRLEHPARVKLRAVPYYSPDLRALSENSRVAIVAFADEIRAGRYPFLGYGTGELGIRPKWNLDFVSGAEWSPVRYDGHECIRHDGSDVKVPYELSRLQFLPVLGKAHLLTGDDSYRQAAKDLLSHWIQSNPVPLGVNWTIAMEAALRAMSICFLLNLVSPFGRDEQRWLEIVTRSLAQHLVYIEANIEFSHFLTSNHYLSDVVGLYCLSVFLDGEGMAARRCEYRRRIEAEMARQVYEDGGDYEASTGYHVLVTQLFTTALLLMRTDPSAPVTAAFVERLRMMFRFLNTVASAAGEVPQVGDCDDGRTELLVDDLRQMVLCPVDERNSLRVLHLLGVGQRLFGEGVGPGDDAAWYGFTDSTPNNYPEPGWLLKNFPSCHPECLLGRTPTSVDESPPACHSDPAGARGESASSYSQKQILRRSSWRHPQNDTAGGLSRERSKELALSAAKGCALPLQPAKANSQPVSPITVLPKSGIGVLRHGSAELLFFAIPNGIFGKGSHTHNDKLSFVLRLDGEEIICDSGTGCYTRDVATRNRFRSTAAHNTLMIDGTEQNRIVPGPPGLFTLGDNAVVSSVQAGREPRGYFLRASHYGYTSLGVTHTRTVRFVDERRSFVIEDELDGDGVHDIEFNLQLAPHRSAEVAASKRGIMCRILDDRQVQLMVSGPGDFQGSTRPSLVSNVYGTAVPAVRVRFWGRAAMPARITTRISWADVPDVKDAQAADSAREATYALSEPG